jgi:DNA (cytosine-5)-methyltransferase 1
VNVLELFAGIGGMSLGLQRAGMTIVGHVEIDPFCRAVLHKHWPEVPCHDDVRTAVTWWLSQPRPRVDVIAGGYPCQPESTAGKRRGHQDERWLWPEMARVIDAVQPRYVIGENVLGHRTKGLRFVLRDLEQLGYTARAGTLSAGEVGAPHRRQRIFVIAELANTERLPGLSRGPGHAEQGQSGRHADRGGVAGHVADTDGEPIGRVALSGEPRRIKSNGPMANTDSTGREPGSGVGSSGPTAQRAGWWTAEPDVGRVAHGIPHRVDRLRALGNAVVPQVAEHIGRIIVDNHASG